MAIYVYDQSHKFIGSNLPQISAALVNETELVRAGNNQWLYDLI